MRGCAPPAARAEFLECEAAPRQQHEQKLLERQAALRWQHEQRLLEREAALRQQHEQELELVRLHHFRGYRS